MASILEVAGDLEPMGNYAMGIAAVNLRLGNQPLLKLLVDIAPMARKSTDMHYRGLNAFVNEDVETARPIPAKDDEVDALFTRVYRELMSFVTVDN